MKAQQYILTLVLTLVTAVNYGQDRNDTSDINVQHLAQVWHLTSSDGTQKTYSSTATNPHGWGATIRINENGEFVDAYSARCGNDQNIHHDTGKWTLDRETMTLTTTFVVLFKKVSAEYQIVSLSDTELVLKEIETPAANNR